MVANKVDNTPGALRAKVALRWAVIENLGLQRTPRVLDAYAGHGRLWRAVAKHVGPVDVTGIDMKPTKRAIQGDNRRVMAGLDLSRFDVIDLDAYGFPAEQAQLVAEAGFAGPMVWTCVAVMLGKLPKVLVESEGVPWSWAMEAPIAVAGCRDTADLIDRWCEYLGRLGWAEHVVLTPTGSPRLYGVSGASPTIHRAAITTRYNVL